MTDDFREKAVRAMNRIAKWRAVFAGWQLGTRPRGDPESDAVRDLREAQILIRVEVNALIQLLVEKDVFSAEEWARQLEVECAHLETAFQRTFPGARATDVGMSFGPEAFHWMSRFPP